MKPIDGPAAMCGRDGWLFLCNDSNRCFAQYLGELQLEPSDVKAYQDLFAARTEAFRRLNINYVTAVASGKERVYAEFLPPEVPPPGPLSLLDQLLREGCTPILDLRSSQARAKQHGMACYKTDSHWTSLGAYFAYLDLAAWLVGLGLDVHIPKLEELRRKTVLFENGDLRSKPRAIFVNGSLYRAAARDVPMEPELIDHYSPPVIRARRVPTPNHLCLSKTRESLVFEGENSRAPRALIFHNSYGMWMAPFLAEHFSRASFAWYPSITRDAVIAEGPDVVIQLTVDRFLRLVPDA